MTVEFGEFCAEHGLELVTSELDGVPSPNGDNIENHSSEVVHNSALPEAGTFLEPIGEEDEENDDDIFGEHCLGQTSSSLIECEEAVRLRSINKITDIIRGTYDPSEKVEFDSPSKRRHGKIRKRTIFDTLSENSPPQIIIVKDENVKEGDRQMVLVGVNCHDRPGLLLDISRGLLRLSLQLRHSEAAVVKTRSLSVWRCEGIDDSTADIEEIWSILNVSRPEVFYFARCVYCALTLNVPL